MCDFLISHNFLILSEFIINFDWSPNKFLKKGLNSGFADDIVDI